MKTIILILLSFGAVKAQQLTNVGIKLSDINVQYVYVITSVGGLSQKLFAALDCGQPEKDRERLKENGKEFVFNSNAHILNVMEKNGWQFVSVQYVSPMAGVTTGYHLFKKKDSDTVASN